MMASLRRKAYDKLLAWKNDSNGASAILINGARRVGKSYLAEEFARNEYDDYTIIDFSNIDPSVLTSFEDYNGNIGDFLNKLSVSIGRTMPERRSLIIFDEVQLYPKARQMIKFLVKDGRYDYIETGSLMSIRTNVENIVIPSEEEDLFLYPLDFEEFLWALGNETAMPYLRDCMEHLQPVGEKLHQTIMGLFRKYMIVGGMPQAVEAFVESNDFEKAESVKRRILTLYRKDIARFARGYEARVTGIFDTIPSELNRKEKSYRITSIGKNARNRDYEDAFLWLNDAMVVNTCVNATDPRIGLNMNLGMTKQKIYMADTGLLITKCLNDDEFVGDEVYKSLLLGKLGINEGMFAENVVAQCLKANGHNLFFYSRPPSPKGRSDGLDEDSWDSAIGIDFLIRQRRKICALEVKSSERIRHDSLDRFSSRFGKVLGQSYVLCTKDIKVEDGIVYLPLYTASLL